MPTLPVSRLINVSVNLAQQPGQAQDLQTLLVLGSSDVIDVVERLRSYSSVADVAADFGTVAPEYLSAVLWFEQAPQPTALKIGRWAKTDTKGKLICAPLSAADSLIATWNAVVDGAFKVNVDGGGVTSIVALNFAAAANLNAVAAIIQAALPAGAKCVYNAVYNRFEFESNTTGANSSISFLTAGAGGHVDISDNIAGLATSSGAYVANGIVAETALASVTLFDGTFGQRWYGLTIPEAVDNDHIAVAGYIEAASNKHIYGVSTSEAGVISSVSTTDIAFLLKALGYRRTLVQYNSASTYSVASYLGRLLTVDYNGQNTVLTMMYKDEPGIVPDNLTTAQADAADAKNSNVFAAFQNDTAIVMRGVQCSGDYSDEVTGADWLAVTIQQAVFNLLFTNPTKIPQTDDGVHLLVTTVESVCSQALLNGLLGPGTWTSNGFGTLVAGTYLAKGFYVYALPVALQSAADRALRKSPPIKVAGKLAGAVHTADIAITLNR